MKDFLDLLLKTVPKPLGAGLLASIAAYFAIYYSKNYQTPSDVAADAHFRTVVILAFAVASTYWILTRQHNAQQAPVDVAGGVDQQPLAKLANASGRSLFATAFILAAALAAVYSVHRHPQPRQQTKPVLVVPKIASDAADKVAAGIYQKLGAKLDELLATSQSVYALNSLVDDAESARQNAAHFGAKFAMYGVRLAQLGSKAQVSYQLIAVDGRAIRTFDTIPVDEPDQMLTKIATIIAGESAKTPQVEVVNAVSARFNQLEKRVADLEGHIQSCPATTAEAQPRPSRHRALLVGVAAYPGAPLTSPVKDAKRLEQVLTGTFGFETKFLKDGEATAAGIKQAIADDAAGCQENDLFLFYFAGHGVQMKTTSEVDPSKQEGSICPVDFDWSDEKAIRMHQLLAFIGACKASQKVVVLDTAHSVSGLSKARRLLPKDTKRNSPAFIVFGGSDADEFDEETPDGSVFTGALLEVLARHAKDDALWLSSLLSEVKKAVRVRGHSQEPQLAWVDGVGDMAFIPIKK